MGLVDDPEISIEEDKLQTINLVLYITNILGIIAVGGAIIESIMFGFLEVGLLYVVFFSPFLFAMAFRKQLSIKTISILIISSGYLIAAYIMMLEGFFGASLIVFLTVVIFATFLLGLKEGIITLSICLLSIFVASFLFIGDVLEVHPAILSSHKKWITWVNVFLTFLLLSTVLALSISRIHKKLQKALELSQNKTDQLSRSNEELSQIKKHLEELVKERTNELAIKNIELERFNKLFVDREFRIKELRDKLKEFAKRPADAGD